MSDSVVCGGGGLPMPAKGFSERRRMCSSRLCVAELTRAHHRCDGRTNRQIPYEREYKLTSTLIPP
eukprot:4469380-Pyramimonas_sp.AAC.1